MYDPPGLPPAGWYPDPERPGAMRWWSGAEWAAPGSAFVTPSDRLPDVGALLGNSFKRMTRHWRAVAVVSTVTTGVASLLTFISLRRLLDGLRVVDDEFVGWSNDRLPVAIALGAAAALLTGIGTLALARIALDAHDEVVHELPAPSTATEIDLAVKAMTAAFVALPRAIGWYLLGVLVGFVALGVIVGAMFVAVPLGILLVLAAIPVGVWLVVKAAFLAHAIVDRRGNPYRRSFGVSADRFWATFGRLLLIGVIAWGISYGVTLATSSATGTGFGSQFGVSSDIQIADDGTVELIDLEHLVAPSGWGIIVGTLGSVVTSVVSTSVALAGFAELYRTRNQRPD